MSTDKPIDTDEQSQIVAQKVMEMLRIAYENNEFYHHTANSEHFTEITQALSEEMFKKATSEYFQFPTEEELE